MPLANLTALFGPARATRPQRRALLRLIATAAENRLQLPELLEAWGTEEPSRQRKRLSRLADLLRNNTSLTDALEHQTTLLSEEELLMVRVASDSGLLAPTLRRWLKRTSNAADMTGGNLVRVVGYVLMFLVLGLPVAFFTYYCLTPQLVYLYYDFGLDKPTSLEISESFSRWAPIAWLLWLIALFTAIWWRLFDWPLGHLRRRIAPRLSRTLRGRQVANLLRNLGDSTNSGRPIAGAVATLARYHYDPSLRHQLLHVRNELGLGADLWSTLATSGVLTAKESAALAASDRVDTRGWTLLALADARDHVARSQLTRRAAVLLPLVVLFFGVFVGWQALGVFSLLIHLIETLV